ncbi:MAG: HIT domain-containing protein [Actinocatenispora sp.]
MAYIRGENKPTGPDSDPTGCPFCRAPSLPDADGLIVARGEHVYALLNLYPYNSGHLMVCPYRHEPDYTGLTDEELVEFSHFTRLAIRAVRHSSGANGFNVGMNQGAAGGAGIAGHLHQHVVPRWIGDTNFMPVIGATKVLPQLLADTRQLLADAWREVVDR